MKYLPINNQLFIDNRKKFKSHLKPKSLAIFNSNDCMPTNADGVLQFRQNNDLFYLSGIDQEETILIIFPDAPKEEWKEILFITETSELIAIWEGHKLTKEQATEISGISKIYWGSQFENILQQIIFECENLYLNTNEHIRSNSKVITRDARMIEKLKIDFPLHQYQRLAPIMNQLRAIKHSLELELMKKSIEITEKAFKRVLKFIKLEIYEFEIEAEITHEFIKNRATRHAYSPIVASGQNSNILHYIENNKICKDGDLILMDFGAEYANYAADLTRTIPVNGRFSDRQKQVYESVLRIMDFAQKLLIKDNYLYQINENLIVNVVQEELIHLGLISKEDIQNQTKEKPAYKKYFMHGVSHFLGLDVHDVGSKYVKLEPGMVLTCEPGIYIKEEGFGIRLENNILITENGNANLMENIPLSWQEIEKWMNNEF